MVIRLNIPTTDPELKSDDSKDGTIALINRAQWKESMKRLILACQRAQES